LRNITLNRKIIILLNLLFISCLNSPTVLEWKHYENKEYGIDLEHPENWYATEYAESDSTKGIVISSINPNNTSGGATSGIYLAIAVYNLEKTNSMNTDGLLELVMGNINEIIINNEESTQFYGRECLHVSLEHTVTDAVGEVYVICEKNYGYAIMYSFIPSELEYSDYEALEQMLESITISTPAFHKEETEESENKSYPSKDITIGLLHYRRFDRCNFCSQKLTLFGLNFVSTLR